MYGEERPKTGDEDENGSTGKVKKAKKQYYPPVRIALLILLIGSMAG